jgi:hypothetical protein
MSDSGHTTPQDSDAEDEPITVEEVEEHKQVLQEYIDEELELKAKLKEVKKQTNPSRKRIKEYMEQEQLEEYRITDTYSLTATRKPAMVVTKASLMSSKIITGKKRKSFLQECTTVKTTFKENTA